MRDPRRVGSLPAQPCQRTPVGGMVIAMQGQDRSGHGRQQRSEQGGDGALDRLGIGPTPEALELLAPLPLVTGHGALAAQGTVGEVVDGPAVGAHGEVGVKREVLGVFEGFKAIDHKGLGKGMAFDHGMMKEQAMTAGAGEMAHGGLVGDAQGPGNLS